MRNKTFIEDILVKKIRAIQADLPVIVCSGFSEDIDKATLEQKDKYIFLEKPIVIRKLDESIRTLLDNSK